MFLCGGRECVGLTKVWLVDALSVLDAATNELESLIDRLDLEATPCTPDLTQLQAPTLIARRDGSPTPKPRSPARRQEALRSMSPSRITSMRPYAQSRGRKPQVEESHVNAAALVAQQITSWPASPDRPKPTPRAGGTVRPGHRRGAASSPSVLAEPLVFKPLQPPKPRPTFLKPRATEPQKAEAADRSQLADSSCEVPQASETFGRRSAFKAPAKLALGPGEPVFRKRSPADTPGTVRRPAPSATRIQEARESDVPGDLHSLMHSRSRRGSLDDTMSLRCSMSDVPPSPGAPPANPLPKPEVSIPPVPSNLVIPGLPTPTLRAFIARPADAGDAASSTGSSSPSDEDTKKSFDFTGELRNLNQSGASRRRSFVEQLESAFMTPTDLDLRYTLGGFLGGSAPTIPPVPAIPAQYAEEKKAEIIAPVVKEQGPVETDVPDTSASWRGSMVSEWESSSQGHDHCVMLPAAPKPATDPHPVGQLNFNFKFGARSPASVQSSPEHTEKKPLTLSDIIPPISYANSLSSRSASFEDDSVLNSIYAQAAPMPTVPDRMRLDSDVSFRPQNRSSAPRGLADDRFASRDQSSGFLSVPTDESLASRSRPASHLSFQGFDSFEQIRRNFEFGPDRPAFYAPVDMSFRGGYGRESVFSLASISSVGDVVHPGVADPFGFNASRRDSTHSDLTMSTTVDDTFAFIKRNQSRQRVDSDASSFYFHAPGPNARMSQIYTRPQRPTSIISPPISRFNRGFNASRRNSAIGELGALAKSYAKFGAAGSRVSFAASIDSTRSDLAAMRFARPGVSDKMFESAGGDYGVPLDSISASPSGSVMSDRFDDRFDQRRWSNLSDLEPTSSSVYSLFEAERAPSAIEESLLKLNGQYPKFQPQSVFEHSGLRVPEVRPYRPVSILTFASEHSAEKEDDTMLSVSAFFPTEMDRD